MPGNSATIIVRVPKAVDKKLDEIAKETGRKKSALVREAIIAFIGMYQYAKKN